MRQVHAHNKLHDAGLSTYRQGFNKLSAHTKKEYRKLLGYRREGSVARDKNTANTAFPLSGSPLDLTQDTVVDWFTKGAVTGVKDQGQCGS
jgi:hypothetical protein